MWDLIIMVRPSIICHWKSRWNTLMCNIFGKEWHAVWSKCFHRSQSVCFTVIIVFMFISVLKAFHIRYTCNCIYMNLYINVYVYTFLCRTSTPTVWLCKRLWPWPLTSVFSCITKQNCRELKQTCAIIHKNGLVTLNFDLHYDSYYVVLRLIKNVR